MSEHKAPYGKQIKTRSILPKAPPLHEEPLRGIEHGKLVCQICGKHSKPAPNLTDTWNTLWKPRKTHTVPHRIE